MFAILLNCGSVETAELVVGAPLNLTWSPYFLWWLGEFTFIIGEPAAKVLKGLKFKNLNVSGGGCCGLVLGKAVASAWLGLGSNCGCLDSN